MLDGRRGCKASYQERNVVVIVALVQGIYNDGQRVRERLLAQLRQRLQDKPLPLVVQAEPMDAVSGGRSIGNVLAQLRRRLRKLDGDRCGEPARGRKIAPTSREEEARAEPLLEAVFAGDRQRDRRLARACPSLEPVYPSPVASVGPSPDLREDVAARVGEAGCYMLLVRRVEGCFGEAVELERSFWGRVGGVLWRESVGLRGENWRGALQQAFPKTSPVDHYIPGIEGTQ